MKFGALNLCMMQGTVRLIAAALMLLPGSGAFADANVYWDFDDGFFPNNVEINIGETMFVWNVDPYDSDVRVTFDGGPTFFLPNLTGQAVTFPSQGTFNFHSDFGDHGSVRVVIPVLDLVSARLEGTMIMFDAVRLTVGRTNILQASTNFTAWTSISTNIANDTTMTFTNSMTGSRRFFRLLELP